MLFCVAKGQVLRNLFPRIPAAQYTTQNGIQTDSNGIVTANGGSSLIYGSLDFGPVGTTKSIRIRYSKGNYVLYGNVFLKLGGCSGTLLGWFQPIYTNDWNNFIERNIYINAENVKDVNDLCLIAGGTDSSKTVLKFEWIELFTPATPQLFPQVAALDYYRQGGIAISDDFIRWFDKNDWFTYSQLNFGPPGTTTGIRFVYAKGNTSAGLQLKLDGTSGQVILDWIPPPTGGWYNYQEVTIYFNSNLIDGIHDLVFFGTTTQGVMNLRSFNLVGSLKSTTALPEITTHIPAIHHTLKVGTEKKDSVISSFDENDHVTYSYINFGPSGTVKTIWVRYAKGNTGGLLELRLNGATGSIIAQFQPENTGGWDEFREMNIPLSNDVSGIHDLTLVGKYSSSILDLEWLVLDKGLPGSIPHCACNRDNCKQFTS